MDLEERSRLELDNKKITTPENGIQSLLRAGAEDSKKRGSLRSQSQNQRHLQYTTQERKNQ